MLIANNPTAHKPTFEKDLVKALEKPHSKQWLAENRNAINAYNGQVEAHGVFSEGIRRF